MEYSPDHRIREFDLKAVLGTCTLAVILPDGPGTSDTMLVDTVKFNAKADALRTKCVEGLGGGGYYHQVTECNVA